MGEIEPEPEVKFDGDIGVRGPGTADRTAALRRAVKEPSSMTVDAAAAGSTAIWTVPRWGGIGESGDVGR